MKTAIIGAGSFGTSLANAITTDRDVLLYSIEEDVVASIKQHKKNTKYFPHTTLGEHVKATSNIEELPEYNVIFLAIPSYTVVDFVCGNLKYINSDAIIINLAKGFGRDDLTIYESLKPELQMPVCALKGPTFAAELINNAPSAMTLGAENKEHSGVIEKIFEGSCIKLDFTYDVVGVELLSILKNIYAIIIGIIDAYYNSANVRFMILTRAFNEMRSLLEYYGAHEDTMFRYCGIGDLGLTSLNDLSRNRTLGLLIGKNFFSSSISGGVVLEGKRALTIFHNKLKESGHIGNSDFNMLESLFKFFNNEIDINSLVDRFIR